MIRNMNPIERVLIIISGLLLIYPGLITDAIGLVAVSLLIIIQIKTKNVNV